jgi:diguanylate cyclase (GGDEF)-like protein
MSPVAQLLIMVLLQQGLIGLAWTAAAAGGLSRAAAWHWCAAAGIMTASLVLVALREQVDPWLGFGLANWLGVVSALLLRRGAQRFCGDRRTDREHLGLAAGTLAALAGWLAFSGPESGLVLITALAIGWSMLRMGIEMLAHLRFEFGPRVAWVLAAPAMAIGTGFALRGLLAPVLGGEFGRLMSEPGAVNARFGLFVMASMLLVHFALGGMAVMRLVARLKHLSGHDPLTGVLNRRGLEDKLERESQRLARYGEGYALLSIDIDHFKRFNDQHGHAAGDAVLEAVARALAGTLRDVDSLGRMGGEEFCVLLPHSGEAAAMAAARRLLERVRQLEIVHAGERLQARVSIGVALADDRRESRHDLLRRLDAALYRAKEQGRDQAVLAAPSVSALRLAAD